MLPKSVRKIAVLDRTKGPDGIESLTKNLFLKPGCNISYQRHNFREEVWTFVSGLGRLKLDGKETEVKAGDDFGAVESVKTSSEIVAPVSGKIIACNTELEDRPELINEDAYAAWIVKIEMSDSSELDSLLNASAYTKLVG